MSKKKSLIHLLASCEKHEFDSVVKVYLKTEFGPKIINTDGKNDKGLDIRNFNSGNEKLQYQLTTQKSDGKNLSTFKIKVLEDAMKASQNVTDNGFSNKLYFFYSYPLTQKTILELRKEARASYQIDLEILDANRLADEALEMIPVQTALYKLHASDDFELSKEVFNEQDILLLDLISFGQPNEFKLQVIEAFIVTQIYINRDLNENDIKYLCEDKFKVKENEVFYEKLLRKLQDQRRIQYSEKEGTFKLSISELNAVKDKLESFENDQNLFVQGIGKILKEYNQDKYIDEYILQLEQLYVQNFDSDLKHILDETTHNEIFGVVKEFSDFISSKNIGKQDSKSLAVCLLRYCLDSKFIQKNAAGKVYCANINNHNLEKYLNTQKRVFVDTQIALYALCSYYDSKNKYDNYFYKTIKGLIDFVKKENIQLYIMERYIWEVQNHIKEAFQLVPFTKLAVINKLGNSKNVFYNFYLYLKSVRMSGLPNSLDEFLKEYQFSPTLSQESFNSKIVYHLNHQSIKTIELAYTYPIDEAARLFASSLSDSYKHKTQFSINNDSIMVEFLADNDVEVHPKQPVFMTWDRSFYDVQDMYKRDHPGCQNWLTISPGKFIDSQALLKFTIDNESLTDNLLALVSDDIISNTHSLLDTIKYVLDPQSSETGLKYTNRLAEIRENEINRLNSKTIAPPEDFKGEAVIDEIFYRLSRHYQEKEDDFKKFKKIFTKDEYIDQVISKFETTVELYYKNNTFDNNQVYHFFDNLIKKDKD